MDLFKVTGWSVSAAMANSSQHTPKKKRKRLPHDKLDRAPHSQHDRGYGTGAPSVETSPGKVDRKKKRKQEGRADKAAVGSIAMRQTVNASIGASNPPQALVLGTPDQSSAQAHRASKKSKKVQGSKRPPHGVAATAEAGGLTALQKQFARNLDGARFRWLNVKLYNSDSGDAHKMMHDDPTLYEEYHVGFRRQVQSWPANPVSHYITKLGSLRAGTVIVDLGCGDAALARALIPKGMTVLSFDLVSNGAFVIEADICGKLPLPGSEVTEEGQVVDVALCSLSLMSSNWLNCIRETWRILKPGGGLHIAEVASRITDIESFVSLITSIGFQLLSKDASNTHFTLFEWKKISGKAKTEVEWARLATGSSVLRPCEYKRR